MYLGLKLSYYGNMNTFCNINLFLYAYKKEFYITNINYKPLPMAQFINYVRKI